MIGLGSDKNHIEERRVKVEGKEKTKVADTKVKDGVGAMKEYLGNFQHYDHHNMIMIIS